MQRLNGVDLFRLIASFFIIALHAKYGNLDQYFLDIISLSTRWAVPYYFIVSGFFLGRKFKDGRIDFDQIKKNLAKLALILLIASVVYTPINIIGKSLTFNFYTIFIGTYFHLWFIGSMIFGYIFIWWCYHIKRERLLVIASISSLIFYLIADSYSILGNIELNSELSRYLIAIPFMFIGLKLSFLSISPNRKWLLLIIIIFGFGLQFIEANILFEHYGQSISKHQFLVGTVIMVIPLFMLSTLFRINMNYLTKWGKNYSLLIYLYHPIVILSLATYLKYTPYPNINNHINLISPIIIFTISLVVSIVLNVYFKPIFEFLNGNLFSKVQKKIEL